MAIVAQPIGILLPVQQGAAGYFNQSFNVIDQIKSNLMMLFNTKKGERRMNPNFGSDLWNLLFEFNDDDLNQIVQSTINRDVATWMPYVNIQQVSVTNGTAERDTYKVDIAVGFTVPSAGVNTLQTLNLSIQQGTA